MNDNGYYRKTPLTHSRASKPHLQENSIPIRTNNLKRDHLTVTAVDVVNYTDFYPNIRVIITALKGTQATYVEIPITLQSATTIKNNHKRNEKQPKRVPRLDSIFNLKLSNIINFNEFISMLYGALSRPTPNPTSRR